MNDKKQNPEIDQRDIALLIMFLGAVGWYKYGGLIEFWFHQHLPEIILGIAAILTICGYIVVRRHNKKNEEEVSRLKRLRDAKAPTRSPDRYYQRRPRQEQVDHE